MFYISDKEYKDRLKRLKRRNESKERWLLLEKEKRKLRNHKKMSTSNKVLTASIMAVILFTIACLYIQYKTSVEVSSTLITLWFSFWTIEIISLAGIKISKVRANKNNDITSELNNTLEESFN
jgi:hypothetical protein